MHETELTLKYNSILPTNHSQLHNSILEWVLSNLKNMNEFC